MLSFIKSGFEKVKKSLGKTSAFFGAKVRALFSSGIDEETFETLERVLYEADLGPILAQKLAEKMRAAWKAHPGMNAELALAYLRKELLEHFRKEPISETAQSTSLPHVVLIVGVNGNGKTTSIAKLAKLYHDHGKKVLIAAADTFRAAATEQVQTWAQRADADLVVGHAGSDPAAVIFDAISAAKARGCDTVLIDTAGRLHTKTPLMQELQKMKRVCAKAQEGAPHETLLVLDATTGQNAIEQAQAFHAATPLTGLILTKLDGTAKGGIALALQEKISVPIRFLGVGEGMDDLQPFDLETFINSLLEA